jgi:DNA-binding NtrC family response regulator
MTTRIEPATDKNVLKLLVVDDSPESLRLITDTVREEGLEVFTTNDPGTALAMFYHIRPRIVLLDLVMPKINGMQLLEEMVAADPGVDILLMTAHYSTDSAVEAIQKGASDYLTKPISIPKLRVRIQALRAEAERRRQTLRLDDQLVDMYQFEGIIGRSPLMLEVFAKIRQVAAHFRNLLVSGPTGTGKELVAHALHNLSPAPNSVFAVCNCSGFVDTLLETELFGYVRGAFTGATHDKEGLFEYANGGTVFLDEIGELPLSGQAKLLRVLQQRQVQRVGSPKIHDVDVRVIAATNRDLLAMVREGSFRDDLYYRLAAVEIALPRLAERREDLALLLRYFVKKFAVEYGKPISGLSRRAQVRLATYPWYGNVRELENVIQNACMMTETNVIDIKDLPEVLRSPLSATSMTDDLMTPLDEVMKRHVLRVLTEVQGNKTRAAKVLGIGRATIYELLARWNLEQGAMKATVPTHLTAPQRS